MIRTKLYLCTLIPYDDAILLVTLRYAQQLKNIDEFSLPEKDLKSYKITNQEIHISEQLVNSMAADWKPENYYDHYSEMIHKIIDKKLSKGLVTKSTDLKSSSVVKSSKSVDFIDLLKKSLKSSNQAQKLSKVKPKKLKPAKKITKRVTKKKRA